MDLTTKYSGHFGIRNALILSKFLGRRREDKAGVSGYQRVYKSVTDRRMREQKVWRYKYEVLPSDSPYVGKVDIIFSEHLLRVHHSYRVRVCDNQNNPEIVDVIEEIEQSTDEEE